MRGPYTQLYLHFVWATWDRLPLITRAIERRVYASIESKCQELKCFPLAIGGIEDHVHLLISFPPTLAPSAIVGEVKGASSHLITHELMPGVFFRWQGSYGAFTVNKRGLPKAIEYIENQKSHHANSLLIPEWETSEAIDRVDEL